MKKETIRERGNDDDDDDDAPLFFFLFSTSSSSLSSFAPTPPKTKTPRSIDEKIKKLDAQLVGHREAIRKARPGPPQDAAKRRALAVLKQKKMLEAQRDQLYNQQFNMEQTNFALESVKDSVATVQAMKAAGAELKTAMKDKNLVRREREGVFGFLFLGSGVDGKRPFFKNSPLSFSSFFSQHTTTTNNYNNRTSPASSPSRTTWPT